MSRRYIEKLQRLMPPPVQGGDEIDWGRLTQSTGWILPNDYQEFVQVYDGGDIDDCISVITPPVPDSHYGDLLKDVESNFEEWPSVDVLIDLLRGTSPPHLLPFAEGSSGDVAFWQILGTPNEWKIVVFRRQVPYGEERWHLFEGGMVQFFVEVLEGVNRSMGDFSGMTEHRFTSWRG
ncbi:SMI1/KNR4 family protein [Streptomyces sp. NPDC002734]|uniref:SMI1/KNR4 family protein n=1 Tax=Streptomyces sp. NPDC002734 TaxID=3154426 RepID=UPI0033166173